MALIPDQAHHKKNTLTHDTHYQSSSIHIIQYTDNTDRGSILYSPSTLPQLFWGRTRNIRFIGVHLTENLSLGSIVHPL